MPRKQVIVRTCCIIECNVKVILLSLKKKIRCLKELFLLSLELVFNNGNYRHDHQLLLFLFRYPNLVTYKRARYLDPLNSFYNSKRIFH